MMQQIVEYLSILSATFLFTEGAEIVQELKEMAGVGNDSPYVNRLQWMALKLVNCGICTGFWAGLIYYQSFLMGCLVAASMIPFNKLISR